MDFLFDTENVSFRLGRFCLCSVTFRAYSEKKRSGRMRLVAVSKSQTRRALFGVVVPSGTEDIC